MSALVYGDPVVLYLRMLRRVVRAENGCWLFTGSTTSRGYGCVGSGATGKSITTHRLTVIARDGFIPEGMTVDHSCHDSQTCRLDRDCPHRRCVNPVHLVVMTQAKNIGRQWEAGLCRKGHPLTERKDRPGRICRTCAAAYLLTWQRARRAELRGEPAA